MKAFDSTVKIVFLILLSGLPERCQGLSLWPEDRIAFDKDKQQCLDTLSLMSSALNNDTVTALIAESSNFVPQDVDLACSNASVLANYKDCLEAALRDNVKEERRALVISPGAHAKALEFFCRNRDIDRTCITSSMQAVMLIKCIGRGSAPDNVNEPNPAQFVQDYCRDLQSTTACLDDLLHSCPNKTRHVNSYYMDLIITPLACRPTTSTTSSTRGTTSHSGNGSSVISVTMVLYVCAVVFSTGVLLGRAIWMFDG